MLVKSNPDEFQDFLTDASYLPGGFASQVVFPETAEEVGSVLADATRAGTPVTVSGAGTGTVAGRVPFGGIVLATEKLNRILAIDETRRRATVQAGVVLRDLQQAVEARGLFYPPDPTERSSFVGGNIATNASGSRTFKYGPTRDYVEALTIAFATGDVLRLRRGQLAADQNGRITIPLSSGRMIEAKLPTYQMPHVRKNASGYFVAAGMDVVDLFIGSEGTLGVIVDAELRLIPKPAGFLSGVVFFDDDEKLLSFVRETRERSLANRKRNAADEESPNLDARALEYFDHESLGFLRERYSQIPDTAVGAIFFEQEVTNANEDALLNVWYEWLEDHGAMLDESWFASNDQDRANLREFRHQLPVLMNEWFARYRQKKVSTDMSVPDADFPEMLSYYKESLRSSKLRHTVFGHIGDNHVHVNILPRDDAEGTRAREIYLDFVRRAVDVGGTLSAEHGIGKLKRDYFREFYTEQHLREMADLKKAFDPAGILGRGNIFSEEYL
jgi:D-lactate dehydrogenase (cytochrome)